MEFTNKKMQFGYPGFAKITVADDYAGIEPPACFDDVFRSWTEEEQSQFCNFFMADSVARIESLGGFVCMPVESPYIAPMD